MSSTDDHPGLKASLTEDNAIIAVEALSFVGLLCRALNVNVFIEVHDLPRSIFEQIDDFEDGDEKEYLSFQDPQRPLWWRRYSKSMIIDCREPPFTGNQVGGRALPQDSPQTIQR